MSTSRASALSRFSFTGAVCALIVGGLAAPASAHNFVVSSTPEDGETVTTLPELWQLTTNDAMLDLGAQGAGFALLITDDAGRFYGDGCVAVQDATMSTTAAVGEAGDYSMVYQFISADGHTLSGELAFTWQPTEPVEPHVGLTEPPVCGETASAPAETAAPSPSGEPTPDASTETSEDAAPDEESGETVGMLLIAGGILAAIVIIGIVFTVVARSRSRAGTEKPAARESDGL